MHDTEHLKKKLESGFRGFRIKNRRVSFLIIFLIIALGGLSLYSIPKESSPDIKFGMINITTIYPGVNPVDMDTLITQEIEEAIDDVDGIKKISSTSRVGVANTVVELYNDIDTQKALVEIKDEIDKVRLPENAEDPMVMEISTSNELMFELLLYGETTLFPPERLRELARDLKNELEGTNGIASIGITQAGAVGENGTAQWGGSLDYDLQVLLDRSKMEQIGLTIAQVAGALRSFNANIPLGNYTVDKLQYDFRIEGEITSEKELLETPIIFQDYALLTLGDIASIKRKYNDDTIGKVGVYKETGFNNISILINKKEGDNVFSASRKAKQAIQEALQAKKYEGLQSLYSSDMSELIMEDYQTLSISGAQTLIFVFLCLLIFISLKESVIATIAIPMAFLVTFMVLDYLWLSLNFLTNFSLVLTLGIAIDTTIVVIEAAYERMKMWYRPRSAILLAIRDFKKPLIAGTSTTIIVFVPMMLLPGVVGKFLAYIPITVFATLVAALFIALTINAALFYKLSKNKIRYIAHPKTEKYMTPEDRALLAEERSGKESKDSSHLSLRQRLLEQLNDNYEKILHKFLGSRRSRLLSVLVPILLLFFTFFTLSPRIGFTLFPASDNNRFDMVMTTKVGSTSEETAVWIPFIESVLGAIPELKLYHISANNNKINVVVDLLNKNDRKKQGLRNVFDVEQDVAEKLTFLQHEGVRVESTVLAGGPPAWSPVGIKLIAQHNNQFDELMDIAKDIQVYLSSIDGVKNASISSEPTPGQFVYEFNDKKLSSLGITPQDIAPEIAFALNGMPAGSITIDDEDRDIKLLYKQLTEEVKPSDITDLIVNTRVGPIKVEEVLDYHITSAVAAIAREDTNITIRVNGDLTEAFKNNGPVLQAQFEERVQAYDFPRGISYEAGGEEQENADLIAATIRGFLISFFMIFVILVLQFNSYRKPAIIMYSIFCAMLGVNIGLFLTGNPYSMPFAIGFIALTGIVVNDAIILIDRITENVSHGVDQFKSIIEAWRSRLQPIILTTLTTLFWVLPIALQDEFWAGLGFTMIFGLFAGSLMTLFVIPSLYYMVFGEGSKDKKRKQKSEEGE